MTRIGDPVVTDARLTKVERLVRLAVPHLVQEAELVSFVLEPGPVKVDGVFREHYPEIAVFSVIAPNPRHPTFNLMESAQVPYRQWKVWDTEHDRKVGVPDPAIFICVEVAKRFAARYENLRMMN